MQKNYLTRLNTDWWFNLSKLRIERNLKDICGNQQVTSYLMLGKLSLLITRQLPTRQLRPHFSLSSHQYWASSSFQLNLCAAILLPCHCWAFYSEYFLNPEAHGCPMLEDLTKCVHQVGVPSPEGLVICWFGR